MTLEQANHYSTKILKWLAPYCERIELAGAVRREQPVCDKIEVVGIPKPKTDIFGDVEGKPEALLHGFLQEYINGSRGEAWVRSSAGVPGRRDTDLLPASPLTYMVRLRKCDLDVHVATEDNFIARLVRATGSNEHQRWIDDRAQKLGGGFDTFSWLRVQGEIVRAHSEAEFYSALNLPFIEPKNRELAFLRDLEKLHPL